MLAPKAGFDCLEMWRRHTSPFEQQPIPFGIAETPIGLRALQPVPQRVQQNGCRD